MILLTALKDKLDAVKAAVNTENAAEAIEANDLNARNAAYEGIAKLATKIKLAVEVNVNDEAFLADMQTLNRRMNGSRAAAKTADNPATLDIDESANANSTSQQSFDDLLATFTEIIARLESRPDYKPNETDVQLATLQTRHAAMTAANNKAKASTAAARTARQTRDDLLYDETDGVLKLVKLIKAYVKQKFSKGDPTYDAIIGMDFSKPR